MCEEWNPYLLRMLQEQMQVQELLQEQPVWTDPAQVAQSCAGLSDGGKVGCFMPRVQRK